MVLVYFANKSQGYGFSSSYVQCESWTIKKAVEVIQSCPTLCDPMDYIFHGILQARILEWVVVPFSRGSSQPRDQTQASCMVGGFFTSWVTREASDYWSGSPTSSPRDLPDPGIELGSCTLQEDCLPAELPGRPIKKAECWIIDAFKLCCWRRLLRVAWTARRSNQLILKEINPECSLGGLMLKLKLQCFDRLIGIGDSQEQPLMLGKIEGRRRRGWQRMKSCMAPPIQWTWTWANSGDGEGQGSLAEYSPRSRKELDTTELLTTAKRRAKYMFSGEGRSLVGCSTWGHKESDTT